MSESTINSTWRRSALLAYPSSIVEFSKVAAPLLAGFSLTAIVELVGRSGNLQYDLAIMSFALAAVLLVLAIQAGLTAAMYQATPAMRLEWVPEARTDTFVAEALRHEQWEDEELAKRYRRRVRYEYNLGIIAFLAGLVLVLIPHPWVWSVPRLIGIGVAGVAAVLEVVGLLGIPGAIHRWIAPDRAVVAAERARYQAAQPPHIDGNELRQIFNERTDTQREDSPTAPSMDEDAIAERVAEIADDIATS